MQTPNDTLPAKENLPSEPDKKRKLFYYAASALLVLILILILWWFFHQKSVGVVSVNGAPREPIVSKSVESRLYQGKYFEFTLPGDFLEKKNGEILQKPILERAYFSRGTVDGKKIAVLVQEVDYPLHEYSSYRIRADDRDYRMETIEKNGLNWTIFLKKEIVYEAGAFHAKDDKVISIIVSSPVQKDGLETELVSILETFRWEE